MSKEGRREESKRGVLFKNVCVSKECFFKEGAQPVKYDNTLYFIVTEDAI